MPTKSTIELISPVTLQLLAGAAGIALVLFLLLRIFVGPPSALSRRWGLLILRSVVILVLLVLLMNPVQVDESPGPKDSPDVFYLLDTSQSMRLGTSITRWDDVTQIIQKADDLIRDRESDQIKMFRFGHSFSAVGALKNSEHVHPDSLQTEAPPQSQPEESGFTEDGTLPEKPMDSDTQLVPALQKLSSRFGRSLPGSVVLFSDGQVRNPAGVENLAEHYHRLGVPIHVVPVGEENKGGDIAIVGLVAPDRVRKQSEVEVQVFLRNFGYDGQRNTIQLWSVDEKDTPSKKLAELPITLRSGIQSQTLTFQSDIRAQKIRVIIPPQSDEISSDNNYFSTDIAVDRTKIRVLYVEGNTRQTTGFQAQLQRTFRSTVRGAYSDLKEALTKDPDIECIVVAASGGTRLQRVNNPTMSTQGFPKTIAELAAFDAIILSNVSRDSFTEEQLEWIEQWVGKRGAGLCMAGGESSFSAGGWGEGFISNVLPVELEDNSDWDPGIEIAIDPEVVSTRHPIWHIVDDDTKNRSIMRSFPPINGANRFSRVKPNLTTILATTDSISSATTVGNSGAGFQPKKKINAHAAIVVGRYGKGRTMAMAAPITAPSAQQFVNEWGDGDNRYYAKFWRNAIYWLTENSSIGRRRLIVSADKRYYQPGENITLRASAYDEGANRTRDYRVVAMIEPQSSLADLLSDYAPIRWPEKLTRESGEDGPHIAWGEEFDLPKQTGNKLDSGEDGYHLLLPIADVLEAGTSSQSLRVELTAYEDFTQVDSTSIDIQILHDPFEQQNPLPNHAVLHRVAEKTQGKVLTTPEELASVINELPVRQGAPTQNKVPLWSKWWLLTAILILLTAEWLWRRSFGLA